MIPQKLVDDSMRALGEDVARARTERGMTQSEFARKAGVSSHTLLDFESGRGSGISYRNLIQILAVAGLEQTITRRTTPIDYVGMYLAPWNESPRNEIGLRVGDSLSRARKRLETKRNAIYGR